MQIEHCKLDICDRRTKRLFKVGRWPARGYMYNIHVLQEKARQGQLPGVITLINNTKLEWVSKGLTQSHCPPLEVGQFEPAATIPQMDASAAENADNVQNDEPERDFSRYHKTVARQRKRHVYSDDEISKLLHGD